MRIVLLFVAAVLLPQAAAAEPQLSVNRTSVLVQANAATNAPSQTVQVRNTGNRALKWSVVPPGGGWPTWLTVSPASGVNSGSLTLRFNTSSLAAGQYRASFTIQAAAGTSGSPTTVAVQANLVGAAPPLTVGCPADITVASSDGAPVPVTYNVSTSGGVAPITVAGSPASGSSFSAGTTPVQVNAQSSDGQTKACGFSVTVTNLAPPSAGVGPQTTIACPAGAVDIFPGTEIQSVVDLYPGDTAFCLRAGVHHRDRSVIPKSGNTFVGEYGAILDGTGWTTTDDTEAAFRAHNQNIDRVTIRNLVIRNLRRGIHGSAPMSDHWTIEYNEIGPNYSGIQFPSDSTIRNNYIHHNSSGGYIGLYSHNSTFQSNEIAYNGWEQKVALSANVTFRNNAVHHNYGGGIWYDTDNTGALVEGNRVEDNGWIGIFYEISSDAIIRNNIIRRSGDAGVFIGTSKNAQIYNNTLENNFRGITYFLNCEAVGGGAIGFDLMNDTAHDNTITVGTQSEAFASLVSYAGSCSSTQTAPYLNGLKNLTFSHNAYHVPSPTTGQYWIWGVVKYWSEWQALPEDLTSTLSP